LSTALQLGVALKALLFHQGFVVLGASGAGAPPPPAVAGVAEGLRASGASSVTGAPLRGRLLGDAQPLGEVSEAQTALYARALAAYDEGAYPDAARDAETVVKSLENALPSTAREALARQVQLVWGAALVQSGQVAAAKPHFRWALERDPFLIADTDRFPPPVQRVFERERTALASETPSRLVVSVGSSSGAGAQLVVDGLPRGALPRDLSLPAHTATFWVEGAKSSSWAHHAALLSDRTLSFEFDLLLEAALLAGDGQLLLTVPSSPQQRRLLFQAVLARAEASDLVVVAKSGPSPAVNPRLTATRFNSSGQIVVSTDFNADQASSAAVARALRGLPEPVVAAEIAKEPAQKKDEGFPVLPVVLGAVGVVAVASVLAVVLWPRNFEVTLTPSSR
jgi:hypothetical protein